MPIGQKPDLSIAGLEGELHFNPLQQFRNVTYNIRLTMMPVIESSIKDDERSYDYTRGFIMAETGGTGSINIEELVITMAGPGNPTASYTLALPAQMSMKLQEPLGARFIESLSLAAYELGYRRNNDALYLLEVWFTGYDDNDLPITCFNWENKPLEYRWYINLTELKTNIDYKGSTYQLKMVVSTGAAVLSDLMQIEQGLRIDTAGTIGELLKNIENALNKREEEKVSSGLRQYPHKYVIKAHKEIANISMNAGGSARRWFFNRFQGGIQVTNRTTIEKFITQALPNSPDFLKFLHRVKEGKKNFNSPDTNPNTLEHLVKQIAVIPGSITQKTEDGDILFDEKLNAPVHEVHFFVTTAANPKSIVSPREYIDANEAAQRNNRVQQWLKMGLLRKAYKWIYTGENTEVIRAEIKIGNLWRIVRPLFINSESGAILPPFGTLPATNLPNPARRGQAQSAQQARQRQGNNQSRLGSSGYAEDLPVRAEQEAHPQLRWRPSFYHANTELNKEQMQMSVFNDSAHEYSVFRQIHAGVGAGSADMTTLDLEVVGDPYYLCQIPPDSPGGKPPKEEETVWMWEKNQWTDLELVDFRQNAATLTTRPNFWFEATVPAADINTDDVMALRLHDSITGIYSIHGIENIFSKGKFTTKLKSNRDVLGNPWTERERQGGNSNNGRSASQTGATNAAP